MELHLRTNKLFFTLRNKASPKNSLAVFGSPVVRLGAFMAKAHSLVGELRPHKPQGMAKINNFPPCLCPLSFFNIGFDIYQYFRNFSAISFCLAAHMHVI